MKIKTLRRAFAFCAALAAGSVAAPAFATNGYIANGYGGSSKGMAGAGVAVPTGVLGLAQNPAMGLKVGNQAGFCLTGFAPDRGFSAPPGGAVTPGSFKSRNPFFLIPCGGVNFHLNDRTTLGIFMFGNGGMNSDYLATPFNPAFGLAGTAPIGVNLEQAFLSANISYQLSDTVAIGAGPVFAFQRFSAEGLQNFAPFSSNPAALTNNGDEWSKGVGVNMGILWEATPHLTFGASYRSKIDMDKFSKYAGLFAHQGDFDIPAVATVGLAYNLPNEPRLTLTAEWQRIFYADVPAISNSSIANPFPFGANGGPGFGWTDMDVWRIGASFKANDKLTLRGGVSYATQFAPSNQTLLNILAPATPQWHISMGASYKLNERWGITGSYTHAFETSVTGIHPTFNPTQPVTVRMNQHEFALGATYRW